jgi:hypothetical protein
MSCVPTSASMSKSVIVSGSSPVLTGRLCALCGSAANVIFATLSLILDCPGLELAVAVHGAGSHIVEFDVPAYPGLYPSFLVFSPSHLGLKA